MFKERNLIKIKVKAQPRQKGRKRAADQKAFNKVGSLILRRLAYLTIGGYALSVLTYLRMQLRPHVAIIFSVKPVSKEPQLVLYVI